MSKLNFSVKIKASRQKIWHVLWNDATYRKWTSIFCEGSYAVSDWKEGSKILFLTPAGDGLYSTIAKSTANEFMSFKHLGVLKNGKEMPIDEETKKWSGATENYTLKEAEGLTELTVEMDITEEHKKYFEDAFPKALGKVKELSEQS